MVPVFDFSAEIADVFFMRLFANIRLWFRRSISKPSGVHGSSQLRLN